MNILLSSASAKVPLLQALKTAAVRLVPNANIIAGDNSSPVVSQYFADDFWQMPPCQDKNILQIAEGLQERQISHVLPSRDGELLFWAKHKAMLTTAGIQVLVAPEKAVHRCLDKYTFARHGNNCALGVIPVLLHPDNTAQLWAVKERYGAGSQHIGLALSHTQARHHAKKLLRPIFQPFIQGTEISIDAWLDKHSKLKGHICRYRTKVRHGESQISQTVTLPEYKQQITHLLEQLKLTGPVVLQGIIDTSNKLHIIECNSRFGGASTLGIKAGVDSLYWSLAEASGIDISTIPFMETPTSITQIRYAQDSYQ